MNSKQLKTYRKAVGFSQEGLSEKVHTAQNTLSQYENGKRSIDSVTSANLETHLRMAKVEQTVQLSNDLVRFIMQRIVEDASLDYWAEIVDVLLENGHIVLMVKPLKGLEKTSDTVHTLDLERLYKGFKHWVQRSNEYVYEQATFKDGLIQAIDDIGISEICQYSLFDDLLLDLTD